MDLTNPTFPSLRTAKRVSSGLAMLSACRFGCTGVRTETKASTTVYPTNARRDSKLMVEVLIVFFGADTGSEERLYSFFVWIDD